MPKLKVGDDELDVDELEGAEEGGERSFEPYDGEQPPVGTRLGGYIKKMWWTYTAKDDPMLKVLVVADEEDEEYGGLPVWENLALTAGAKFKWAPFLRCFGLTIRDVKTKTVVDKEDDDSMGGAAPILKIGNWEVGGDDSWFTMVTSREKYNGSWQTHVGSWLPYSELEEDDPEEKPAPKATRSRRAAPADDEEEEAPAPTRGRGRKAAAKEAPPARGRGRRAGGAKGGEADDEPPF